MGRGLREFKAVGSTPGRNRRSKAHVADAAAIIVHRLVGALAAEANGHATERGSACALHYDFYGIVRQSADNDFLHPTCLR
ncbi:conserved protein of unknown function (plasmid) [Shinella sp. WSC3-e]|nr:conserved hypothetical protein [Rhizobiaceae bacterium]CAK7260894.1 conserved protein of unknown function [Shinella sp. WSC3-e]